MSQNSSTGHTCSLLREDEVLHKGLSISLDLSGDPEQPHISASILREQNPTEFEVYDQFQMVLDDGRSGEVVVSEVREIRDGLYIVVFSFLSGLK